jgi:hypothetical protein
VLVGAAVVLAGVVLLLWLRPRGVSGEEARERFAAEWESLKGRFFEEARASGKPRGLRWVECDWGEEVAFARERATGMVVALAGVTIRFEAVEGSDMEGLPAVGNLRHASGVFSFDGVAWQTGGQAVFNLGPREAVERLGERVEWLEG